MTWYAHNLYVPATERALQVMRAIPNLQPSLFLVSSLEDFVWYTPARKARAWSLWLSGGSPTWSHRGLQRRMVWRACASLGLAPSRYVASGRGSSRGRRGSSSGVVAALHPGTVNRGRSAGPLLCLIYVGRRHRIRSLLGLHSYTTHVHHAVASRAGTNSTLRR